MKLHIFQSDMGDCMLLESRDKKNILCDGGMAVSMKAHVRQHLSDLRRRRQQIDYAYVSHIDSDHISGILQLLQDELEWRVFEHHQRNGSDANVRRPRVPRPPRIAAIWHNAFRDQIDQNEGDVEKLLAAAVPVALGTGIPAFMAGGEALERIAASIPEALKVSKLASPDLLDIPVNKLPRARRPARLIFFRRKPQSFKVGSMRLTIVGPTEAELDDLRKGWNNWLGRNQEAVQKIRAEMRRRLERFESGDAGSPFDLGSWNGIPDHEGVTPPNVASLMFMVEEDGKRLLLTGDSHHDMIIRGLELTGFLADGHVHLDVLKVQHHGATANMDAEFCRKVSADHYVFCGNGEHGNPEPEVLKLVHQSRLGPPARRALSPRAADRPFKFWFSTTSALQRAGSRERRAFAEAERLVAGMIAGAGGRMTAEFNGGDFITLAI